MESLIDSNIAQCYLGCVLLQTDLLKEQLAQLQDQQQIELSTACTCLHAETSQVVKLGFSLVVCYCRDPSHHQSRCYTDMMEELS